ncbi:MAG TPA: radical SAM protein, partial [Elusimicrobiales bacterium]|nr:radical SAM protein [Elusimicrobiales bacterium]
MKTLDCASFRAKLSGLARRRRIPLRVMLELTYNCNFNCPHCYVPNSHKLSYRKRELPAARWREIISQLAEEGCLQIGFTGGEPLLKKGFFSILRHAKRCGLETYLYTNGSLIDSQTARQLRRAGCDKADITIPAIGKSAFEKVTGAASCHQRFLRAAALLKK